MLSQTFHVERFFQKLCININTVYFHNMQGDFQDNSWIIFNNVVLITTKTNVQSNWFSYLLTLEVVLCSRLAPKVFSIHSLKVGNTIPPNLYLKSQHYTESFQIKRLYIRYTFDFMYAQILKF